MSTLRPPSVRLDQRMNINGEPVVNGKPVTVNTNTDDFKSDMFSSIRTPNVKIGMKPLPLTSAVVKSDLSLVESLTSVGYDYVLLPVTNARYRENCKKYFQTFKENSGSSYNDGNEDNGYNDNEIEVDLNDLNVPFPKLNEVNIMTGSHCRQTICLLSSWIELDTTDKLINEFSLQVITNEISYAHYVGINTLLIAPPKDLNHLSIFTNNLNSVLTRFPAMKISISLPICEDVQINNVTGESIPVIDTLSTWDMWNTIRIQCNYNENLSVSLGSPKHNIPQGVVNRWLLEPVKFYLISSSRFIPNSKNYPVLNKFNQLIIWKLIQKKALDPPVLLLHGVDKDNDLINKLRTTTLSDNDENIHHHHNSPKNLNKRLTSITVDGKSVYLGDLAYLDYLKYLVDSSEHNNQLTPIENFTINNLLCSNLSQSQMNSAESLQAPLQPLLNNLDNSTYKVFEQDSVKYDCYERAMVSALMDLINLPRFHHAKQVSTYGAVAFNTSALSLPDRNNTTNHTTTYSAISGDSASNDDLKILIVGPGRGPLIEKLFCAFKFLNLNLDKVKITAIEKNPNVMVYLTQRNKDYWNNKVEIINSDARFWQPTTNSSSGFNMVVSELLGSFGCNELSPECLDSVEKFCDSKDCIFIPKEYTSYIAPAISPSIYKKVSKFNDPSKFHQMYIPMCDQHDVLSSKCAKLWTFKHPTKRQKPSSLSSENCSVPWQTQKFQNNHNKRQIQTTLKCHRKGTIHGLIGFFTAELYNGITISNDPTGSGPIPHNLVSWLPCFFMIDQPIHLTDDQEISIFIKRDCNLDRVWYEWSIESFIYVVLPLENSISRGSTGTLSRHNSNQHQRTQSQTQASNVQLQAQFQFGASGGNGGPSGPRYQQHNRERNSMFSNELRHQLTEDSYAASEVLSGGDKNEFFFNSNNNNNLNNSGVEQQQSEEEYQVRVRTGVSRIHNPNGVYFSMKL